MRIQIKGADPMVAGAQLAMLSQREMDLQVLFLYEMLNTLGDDTAFIEQELN
jgi:hypothetical protein